MLSTRVITDRDTGVSKGYGFVNMADSSSAQTAMAALDNYKLNDRVLAVKIAGRKDGPMGGFGAGPPMARPGMPPPGEPELEAQSTSASGGSVSGPSSQDWEPGREDCRQEGRPNGRLWRRTSHGAAWHAPTR